MYVIAIITVTIVVIGILLFLWYYKRPKKVSFDESYQPPSLNHLTSPEKFKEYMKNNYTDVVDVSKTYPLINAFGAVVPVNTDNPSINNKGDLTKLQTMKSQISEAINQFTKLKNERINQLKDTSTAPDSAFKSLEEREVILNMLKNIIMSADEIIKFLSN